MPDADSGYAVIVQPSRAGWVWAVTGLDAEVAASGEAPDQDTAWRTGLFAAAAIRGLRRASRRSV